jgi:hypothetical protein
VTLLCLLNEKVVNVKEGKLLPKQRDYLLEDTDLVGVAYCWKVQKQWFRVSMDPHFFVLPAMILVAVEIEMK